MMRRCLFLGLFLLVMTQSALAGPESLGSTWIHRGSYSITNQVQQNFRISSFIASGVQPGATNNTSVWVTNNDGSAAEYR